LIQKMISDARLIQAARALDSIVAHLKGVADFCNNICQERTRTPQQTSGSALAAVIFVYLSVECPFYKFDGINCRPKLGAKLLNRFFHRRRQVSPPVNNVTHRFFDGSEHFLYRNFTVGSRHSAVASSSSR
jgi:hypothetical protein